jgi:cysteine-rich repeat protein
MRTTTRFIPAIVLAALLATTGAVPEALAHDATHEISGRTLKIDTSKTPVGHKFAFKTVKDSGIFPQHDPATEGAALLVRWTGQSGVGAGRTPLIELDPAMWKGIGNPSGSKGYKYKDNTLSAGGIRTVSYKPGNGGGQLKVSARGANWTSELGGPHDSVWVHFQVEDEWYCAEFGGEVTKNEPGRYQAKNALAPATCPTPVCGNGATELGEECDDGNLVDDDGCDTDCTIGSCTGDEYDSTFEAIQAVIFDSPVYGCNSGICHGATPGQGSLDLRAGTAYGELVNVASQISPATKRVLPGEPALSVLYDKLYAGTHSELPAFGGTPMPSGATPLTEEHLEAVELWIRGGAPEDLVVSGTAALLATCLPEPDPLTIPPPDPPASGAGVQLRMPPWPLPAQSENEVCKSTYYDFTATSLVPESAKISCTLGAANNPSGECFLFHKLTLAQDPQSHHAILHIYDGAEATTHSAWGPWTYKFQDQSNPLEGTTCDPTVVDTATGYAPGCSSQVVPSVGCVGYGPPDAAVQFSAGLVLSQEGYFEQEFADGVYNIMPMAGIFTWNSHAFNTTSGDTTMSQYLNLDFAGPGDQSFPVQDIFDAGSIFIANVPPFETRQYCRNYTIPSGSNLFHLTSHTHRHGVQFRIWEPPNAACAPGSCPEGSPGQLIYTSVTYEDPLQLYFDPPQVYTGSTAARTFRYCSLYDNGSAPGSPSVKLASNPVGSTCGAAQRECVSGPNQGVACNGNDAFCDSSPGSGDGSCDACPVQGGVTTEDEMFILIGSYY